MTLTLIAIGAAALVILWLLPKLQLRSTRKRLKNPEITLSDYLKAENDRRVTIAQILGGLAVLTGLLYSSRTVRLQESGQLTDRINKAVEQLGSDNVPVELGGIHQLGRIAADYDEERYPMLQVLTSYVEVKAALKTPLRTADCDPFKLREFDRQPALTSQAVIGVLIDQIPRTNNKPGRLAINRADLRYVDFSGGKFATIQLAGDDLTGTNFERTSFAPQSLLAFSLFTYSDLTDSDLSGVRLHHACMAQARLRNASLRNADLSYVDFRGVEDVKGTDFTGAILDHADLRGVDLTETKGLTAQQLQTITCGDATRFPEPLASLRDTLKCTQAADF